MTAGTRQPYSIESAGDLAHLGQRPLALLGREADVVHEPEGDDEHHHQDAAAEQERARRGWSPAAMSPPATEPVSIATPETIWPAPEDRLEVAVKPVAVERVDEPRLDRAGEEREPEAEQHRDARAHSQNGASICHSST